MHICLNRKAIAYGNGLVSVSLQEKTTVTPHQKEGGDFYCSLRGGSFTEEAVALLLLLDRTSPPRLEEHSSCCVKTFFPYSGNVLPSL